MPEMPRHMSLIKNSLKIARDAGTINGQGGADYFKGHFTDKLLRYLNFRVLGLLSTYKGYFPLANFFARRDLFPLSASILPRLADVISDTDKGKRSLRAKKFSSGKPAYNRESTN